MAKYVTELNIEAYRGIKDLEIKNLGDVNILVGENNCGKTSVLEVLTILANPSSLQRVHEAATCRLFSPYRSNKMYIDDELDTILSIFQKTKNNEEYEYHVKAELGCLSYNSSFEINLNTSGQVSLMDMLVDSSNLLQGVFNSNFNNKENTESIFIKKGDSYTVESKLGHFNFARIAITENLLDEFTSIYKVIFKNEKKSFFMEILNLFGEKITDVSLLGNTIWLTNADGSVRQLFSYGTGMQRAFLISLKLIQAEKGLLLIDEIETGIHIKALKEVFSFILRACKKMEIQLFLTTHSLEAIECMLECSIESIIDTKVITLVKRENKTYARVFNTEEAIRAKDVLGLELR